MNFPDINQYLINEPDIEQSTMMRTPCLRYKGEFLGMFFEKADAMIIKVSASRVDELVASGEGMEFNTSSPPAFVLVMHHAFA